MAEKSRSGDPPNGPKIDDLTALFGQMLSRDEAMWSRLSERDSKVQGKIVELLGRMIDNQGLDQVLIRGFDKVADQITAQTAPLRSLGKEYKALKKPADQLLRSLELALERQDFSHVTNQSAIGTVGSAPRDRSAAS